MFNKKGIVISFPQRMSIFAGHYKSNLVPVHRSKQPVAGRYHCDSLFLAKSDTGKSSGPSRICCYSGGASLSGPVARHKALHNITLLLDFSDLRIQLLVVLAGTDFEAFFFAAPEYVRYSAYRND